MTQIDITNVVQHRYGGLCTILHVGTSTVDLSEQVVYVHLFPFEQKVWVRPRSEWTDDRFRLLAPEEARELLTRDREQFKAEITANKAASKNS